MLGCQKMIPILTGVIPFGLVMGTVTADAGLNFTQSVAMNLLAYAGAAQLAAIDLMSKHAPIFVVVITGLVINLRFLLYSAAMAPALHHESAWKKLVSGYFLTDQAYAAVSANHDNLPTEKVTVQFYLGASACMAVFWHLSVALGFMFGNFAPKSWSLEYAVPLSFVALLTPSLKTKVHFKVAAFSALMSIVLHKLPFRLGLVATAVVSMTLAALLTHRRVPK